MKWEQPKGSTQATTDGRYLVVHATSQQWIAYKTFFMTAVEELGVRDSEGKARDLCEAEESMQRAGHRRSA